MKKWSTELKEKYFGIDGALIAAGAIVLILAMWFFFKDEGLNTQGRELIPVGSFSLSKNDVRRRISTGFTWGSISAKDTVFEGDSIFTGEDSNAQISLDGGSQLKIDPKSLVVVRTRGSGLQLDLQYGSLVGKVSGDKPLLISQNGQLQEVRADDAEIRIEATEGKETKIQVVRGKIAVKAVAPKSKKKPIEVAPQIVAENEVVELKAETAPVVRKISATLVKPADGDILWVPLGRPLGFEWKFANTKTAATTRFEISRDAKFEPVLFSTDVNGNGYSLAEEKRPAGTFLWRVRPIVDAKNAAGGASSSSTLTVYPDVPPMPKFPLADQAFGYNAAAGESGKAVDLSWQDEAGSTEFEVQIAKDDSFKQPLVTKKTTVASDRTPSLPAGRYFWRIKGLHAKRLHSPFSKTMNFHVEEDARAPDAPKLAKTKIDYEIPETVLAKAQGVSVAGRGLAPENLAPFSWNENLPADKNVESFEIEVAPEETFVNSIKQDLGKQNSFTLNEVKPGSVFVRVRAKGKKGLVSPPSETGRLDVQLPAPKLAAVPVEKKTFKTPDELAAGKHEFKLNWTPRPFAESYELEWGTNAEFSQSKKFRLKSNERSIAVTKPMDYTARVRALGPEGTPLSPYSNVEVASFKKEIFIPPPPISVPKPTAPLANAPSVPRSSASVNKTAIPGPAPMPQEPLRNSQVVSLDDSVTFVNFKWRGLAGVEFYELQLAEDADFSRVITTLKARSTTYTLQKTLPEGRVFWRVRAHKGRATSEWSPVFDINVLYQ